MSITSRNAALLAAALILGACGHAPVPFPTAPVAATTAPARTTPEGPPAQSVELPQKLPGSGGDAAVPRVPFAVVVGNDPEARPQSGIDRADLVWEVPAEGFITRYFAIFDHQGGAQIGPVRSARIYFDELARAYNLPLVHAGANQDALYAISTWHLMNIDEIYGGGQYFWRTGARRAPENLYTSSAQVNRATEAMHAQGLALAYPPAGELPLEAEATSGVQLTYLRSSVYTYVAGWRWEAGWWRRMVNGSPLDTLDGAPVRAGTVVVLAVPEVPDHDPTTPGALKLLWQKGGEAWVLQGGRRAAGRWTFTGTGTVVHVTDPQGVPLAVSRQLPIWYEVVPSAGDVAFEP